jgi:uncharacterized protein (TIGR00369 family)
MTEIDDAARFERVARFLSTRRKGLIAAMNLKPERADRHGVVIRMPHNPDFCVDEEGTLLHGGILTALLDTSFGMVNFLAIEDVQTMATLDLRVEYLRPAQSRADVMVFAECYRQTRHIAFCSGKVWFDGASGEEVARGAASFALTRGESGPRSMLGAEAAAL